MHYHAEVWIPKVADDLDVQIREILWPFCEENEAAVGRGAFWDWFQIGGRWKGVHAPGYDQGQDPDHKEECWLCAGTGMRPGWAWTDESGARRYRDLWAEECRGCNGCKGTGIAMKWPTQWVPHSDDLLPVKLVPDGLECSTLIVGDKVFHKEEWNGEDWVVTDFDGRVKPKLKELGIESGYLVTVDYHS